MGETYEDLAKAVKEAKSEVERLFSAASARYDAMQAKKKEQAAELEPLERAHDEATYAANVAHNKYLAARSQLIKAAETR